MGVKRFGRLFLVAVLAGPAGAYAETDPLQWLVRADRAAEQASFTATLSLQVRGAVPRTMKVEQGFDGRHTHRRWVSVSGGEDCEIVRRGNESAVAFPGRRVVIHGRHRHPEGWVPGLPMDLGRIGPHYELDIRGREQVAGRDCQLVLASSRDHYRYGCELCVDVASGLPLRVRMVVPGGGRIEQFSFLSLDLRESIHQFTPDSFWMETDIRGFEAVSLPHGAHPSPGHWRVGNLPPGFEERLAVVRRLPRDPEPVYHMVLADALSRISVFIARLPADGAGERLRFSRKALNGYVTVRDGHQVTVIGGVPAETVQMIGDSVHRVAETSN